MQCRLAGRGSWQIQASAGSLEHQLVRGLNHCLEGLHDMGWRGSVEGEPVGMGWLRSTLPRDPGQIVMLAQQRWHACNKGCPSSCHMQAAACTCRTLLAAAGARWRAHRCQMAAS